ncbi:MAG: ribokinase [Betaproteobacteria bacterium]
MIIVLGSVNLDLVARVPRLPSPGETLAGTSFAALPGGKGANQALAARRAGADVIMIGAVGRDAFAVPALAGLRVEGVDIDNVATVAQPTGVALIHIDAAGENAITIIAGANGSASADNIDAQRWSQASTLLMQLEIPITQVTQAACEARRRGVRVILNAAPMQFLPAALLEAIDVLVVNEHEAAALAAQLHIDTDQCVLADMLSQQLDAAVVLTLGAHGAMAAVDGIRLQARPPAISVVDTTGAGDAFTGALASALQRNLSWPLALAAAVAAGSLACSSVGAQSALADAVTIAALAERVELSQSPFSRVPRS